jgi:RNA polymerase sigma-70 factor (ECF subfamily)
VTDGELVQRARDGDAAAFGELVDRHRAAVYRATLAALGSHADAEDAAQEAFLRAYRRLRSFRGDASFKTWVLIIAWRFALNRRRNVTRLLRRFVGDDSADAFAETPSIAPTPEDAAAAGELHRAVRAAIVALSPKLRDALLLATSGAMTYEEIGAMVGAPTGTIKWRVSEARRLVKQQLRERGHVV